MKIRHPKKSAGSQIGWPNADCNCAGPVTFITPVASNSKPMLLFQNESNDCGVLAWDEVSISHVITNCPLGSRRCYANDHYVHVPRKNTGAIADNYLGWWHGIRLPDLQFPGHAITERNEAKHLASFGSGANGRNDRRINLYNKAQYTESIETSLTSLSVAYSGHAFAVEQGDPRTRVRTIWAGRVIDDVELQTTSISIQDIYAAGAWEHAITGHGFYYDTNRSCRVYYRERLVWSGVFDTADHYGTWLLMRTGDLLTIIDGYDVIWSGNVVKIEKGPRQNLIIGKQPEYLWLWLGNGLVKTARNNEWVDEVNAPVDNYVIEDAGWHTRIIREASNPTVWKFFYQGKFVKDLPVQVDVHRPFSIKGTPADLVTTFIATQAVDEHGFTRKTCYVLEPDGTERCRETSYGTMFAYGQYHVKVDKIEIPNDDPDAPKEYKLIGQVYFDNEPIEGLRYLGQPDNNDYRPIQGYKNVCHCHGRFVTDPDEEPDEETPVIAILLVNGEIRSTVTENPRPLSTNEIMGTNDYFVGLCYADWISGSYDSGKYWFVNLESGEAVHDGDVYEPGMEWRRIDPAGNLSDSLYARSRYLYVRTKITDYSYQNRLFWENQSLADEQSVSSYAASFSFGMGKERCDIKSSTAATQFHAFLEGHDLGMMKSLSMQQDATEKSWSRVSVDDEKVLMHELSKVHTCTDSESIFQTEGSYGVIRDETTVGSYVYTVYYAGEYLDSTSPQKVSSQAVGASKAYCQLREQTSTSGTPEYATRSYYEGNLVSNPDLDTPQSGRMSWGVIDETQAYLPAYSQFNTVQFTNQEEARRIEATQGYASVRYLWLKQTDPDTDTTNLTVDYGVGRYIDKYLYSGIGTSADVVTTQDGTEYCFIRNAATNPETTAFIDIYCNGRSLVRTTGSVSTTNIDRNVLGVIENGKTDLYYHDTKFKSQASSVALEGAMAIRTKDSDNVTQWWQNGELLETISNAGTGNNFGVIGYGYHWHETTYTDAQGWSFYFRNLSYNGETLFGLDNVPLSLWRADSFGMLGNDLLIATRLFGDWFGEYSQQLALYRNGKAFAAGEVVTGKIEESLGGYGLKFWSMTRQAGVGQNLRRWYYYLGSVIGYGDVGTSEIGTIPGSFGPDPRTDYAYFYNGSVYKYYYQDKELASFSVRATTYSSTTNYSVLGIRDPDTGDVTWYYDGEKIYEGTADFPGTTYVVTPIGLWLYRNRTGEKPLGKYWMRGEPQFDAEYIKYAGVGDSIQHMLVIQDTEKSVTVFCTDRGKMRFNSRFQKIA